MKQVADSDIRDSVIIPVKILVSSAKYCPLRYFRIHRGKLNANFKKLIKVNQEFFIEGMPPKEVA